MSQPRIAVVLPRNMVFTKQGATSIDLCAHDFVMGSKYRDSTVMYVEEVDNLFPGFELRMRGNEDVATLIRQLKADRPDLIVMHQHMPTGAKVARATGIPTLVHRHNYYNKKGALSRLHRRWQMRQIAGIISVSHSVNEALHADWGTPPCPTYVVHNALDMSEWMPKAERVREIVFAGRANWVKGLVPLARALAEIMPSRPDWHAHLMVSRIHKDPQSWAEAQKIIKPLWEQVSFAEEAPFAEVKARLEAAEISVMPTLRREPFGRSAIEAMAGGAALAASTLGGLKEVLGDSGAQIDPVDPAGIAAALTALMDNDAHRRSVAAAGLERAHRLFDLKPVCAQLDAVYDAVLGR